MNEESETVEPPISDKIGPKFGIDWATNKTDNTVPKRIKTRLTPNAKMRIIEN